MGAGLELTACGSSGQWSNAIHNQTVSALDRYPLRLQASYELLDAVDRRRLGRHSTGPGPVRIAT